VFRLTWWSERRRDNPVDPANSRAERLERLALIDDATPFDAERLAGDAERVGEG